MLRGRTRHRWEAGGAMSSAEGPLGVVNMAATTLYVSDIDKAIDWYGDKLGLEPAMAGTDDFRYAGYLLGGVFVVLEPIEAAVEAVGPGAESTTVNVIVEKDPADVRDALMARGVACGPLGESPGFVSFLMRDLDGNRFYVTRPHSSDAQASVGRAIEDSSA
jgi:catechol 2,3-dioxygenase-like lactoylglutathione lyase family enzyme